MEHRVLKPQDADYPRRLKERLGSKAPTLYTRGELAQLSRWTLAFFTADVEPGGVPRALWNLFFPVFEYEMNAVGPWQSVNEGVFLRSALEKPWISLTLFSLRGIGSEDFGTFLAERHKPPQDSFVQRPEYERRAAAGELLLLSLTPTGNGRPSRGMILRRNWVAANLADAVFIGGAVRLSKEWASREERWVEKRQKTFELAERLARNGIPTFTVDHPENKELIDLGISAQTPKSIREYLSKLGAGKGRVTENRLEVPTPKRNEKGDASPRQLSLFPNPRRKR